ncbi:MAG: O-antigen ligase family protein [Thermincolia bacterium]
MVVAIIFVGFYLRFKHYDTPFLQFSFDYIALGFILAYILAVPLAVNYRSAIIEVIKLTGYFFIYYMISRTVNSFKDINYYLKVLYFSGIGVALLGLGAAFGTFNLEGAYYFERISSTLQYPNSLAVFMTVVFVLGLYLYITEENVGLKFVYSAGNYLSFLTLIGTQSRGGWMVAVFVLFLFAILAQRNYRVSFLIQIFYIIIISILLMPKVLVFNLNQPQFIYWLWLLTGAVLLSITTVLNRFIYRKIEIIKIKFPQKYLTGVILLFLIFVVIVSYKGIYLTKAVPLDMIERVRTINIENREVQERFVFYKDAVKIINDNFIVGTGGGGWSSIYRKYQSYYYSTSQVHNHFLQVWVEAGLIGFGFFCLLWFTFARSIWRLLRSEVNYNHKFLATTIFIAALALGLHSLIDFNLSLGSLSILLWTLFGLGLSLEILTINPSGVCLLKINININQKIKKGIIATVCVAIAFSSLFMLIGELYRIQAAKILNTQQPLLAKSKYELARKVDPLSAESAADLAQAWYFTGKQENDVNKLEVANEYARRAVALNSGDPKIRAVKAKINLSLGEIPESIKEFEEVRALWHWNQGSYDDLAEAYLIAGQYYIDQGEKEKAKFYLEKAVKTPDLVIAQLRNLTPQSRKLWTKLLEISPVIQKSSSQANELLTKVKTGI